MNLTELIQKYQSDATQEQMLDVTKAIDDFVTKHATEEDLHKLYKEIYGIVGNGHFNAYFAEAQIAKMNFEDVKGVEHRAPYCPPCQGTRDIRDGEGRDKAIQPMGLFRGDEYGLLRPL